MKTSYKFEEMEDREAEIELLAERALMRIEEFPALVARHGFYSGKIILDLGCGHGIRTHVMSKLFFDSQVIGVDQSEELIKIARSETSQAKFCNGDVYNLPFKDQSVDCIYSRLVFMHLSQPLSALSEIRRVLKPGGRVLIEDADRDCMFFEPQPQSFPEFWRNVQAGQRQRGGDPNVGRKLSSLFRQSGFKDINLEIKTILGSGSEIKFLTRTLMPALVSYCEPAQRIQALKAIDDLIVLADDPSAQFIHFWFAVSASL